MKPEDTHRRRSKPGQSRKSDPFHATRGQSENESDTQIGSGSESAESKDGEYAQGEEVTGELKTLAEASPGRADKIRHAKQLIESGGYSQPEVLEKIVQRLIDKLKEG